MSHYDEMTLALIALGEPDATSDDAVHLSTCERCRDEVDQLGAVVATGRTIQDADYPSAPSAAVWDRIVADIHAEDGAAAASTTAVVALDEARARRRRRTGLSLAAAAAVGLIVGVGGTWTLMRTPAAAPPIAAPGQVSVAALEPKDMPMASGTAVLRVVSASQRTVTVSVANLPAEPGAFYEVWLMDPSDAHLVALGVLGTDGRGAYVVPTGLDLRRYSAVDVSLQPMNGSPEHSGTSAVRGTISA